MKISKEAQLSIDLFNSYSRGDRVTWADEVVENRDFKLGAQLTTEQVEQLEADNQFTGTVNEILPAIDLVSSMLTENNPRYTVGGTETSDSKTAQDVTDLHSWIWDNSDGNMHLKSAVEDFVTDGLGALMVYVDPFGDYGKGEIMIADIDPMDLYYSPLTKRPDGLDSPHILVVKNLTEEWIKENTDLNIEDLNAISVDENPISDLEKTEGQVQYPEDETLQNKYRAIDRYTKVMIKRYYVYDTSSQFENIFTEEDYIAYSQEDAVITVTQGQEQYLTKKADIKEMMDLFAKTGGIYHMIIDVNGQQQVVPGAESERNAIPGSTTQIKKVTKKELIDIGVIKVTFPKVPRIKRVYTIGDVEVFNDILPIENYPIVSMMLHHSRNPYPLGDVAVVKSLQKQLNKVMQLIIAYNTNITNVKGFIPRGTKLKKELEETGGKAGAQWYEYDPELGGVPIMIQLTQMSSALYEEKREIAEQIRRIIGAHLTLDGAQPQRTKGGTQLLNQFGSRRINLKRKNVEHALNKLAKVVSEMIPNVYTERKVIRIAEPNHKSKIVVYNDTDSSDQILNDLSLRYDVKVIPQSTLPTDKLQTQDMLIAAFQNGIIRDPSVVIQHMDGIEDVDAIIEREDRLRQLEGQLNQASEKIKDLEGQLQTTTREAINANKRTEVQKFKTDLNKIENKANLEIAKSIPTSKGDTGKK